MKVKIYWKYALGSLGVHGLAFGLLLTSLPLEKVKSDYSHSKQLTHEPISQVTSPIQSAVINEDELNEAVAQLEAKEQAKKKAHDKQVAELKALQSKRLQEEKRITAARKEEAALKEKALKQRKEEQAALEKLKKAKEEALIAQKAAEKGAETAKLEEQALEKKRAELKAKQRAEEEAQRQAHADNLVARHTFEIGRVVTENWRRPIGIDNARLSCLVSIKTIPTGEVIEAKVVKSSGNSEFDRSAELAIFKASPLPMPKDSLAVSKLRDFNFEFKPEG